ncbi:MAG: MBL fold metallo-hydrolase [Pseudonocardiales bacterium]|nr:MBL fold metallo-hydrolase [Pseudonocardiales bacterium]PZS23869.1 MAG: MBL fold metallo-hydrolase [Pseudonocardiales bacterium]
MHIITIETKSLGDRSYLVHDGTAALVIDPQRDIDRVEQALAEAGVRLTHVAETHIHNDYLSGGLELARRHGAAYLVNAADEVSFERHPVTDGDEFAVGELTVRAVATPGHTENHLAYLVSHDGQRAVFSGGNLLFGSVGRTDLVDPTITAKLTHAQYQSARSLAETAGDEATLHPTHGFGSFCSSGPATGQDSSTIGEQRELNHALTDPDEQHFVEELLDGLTGYPSYYAHMSALNGKGVDPVDLTVPAPVDPAELRRRVADGGWVVDLRNRVAFAGGHLAGTLSFEHGPMFTSFLGWVVPWGDPITLVGSEEQVTAAVRDLSRIGIDHPEVAIGEDVAALGDGLPMMSYPVVGWSDLVTARQADEMDVLLDTRRDDEWAAGHIDGAVHIPLHELPDRLDDVPSGRVWVHCGTGYRASTAASILHRAGRDVRHINQEYAAAGSSGLMTVTGELPLNWKRER